jgi:hypothetical protein
MRVFNETAPEANAATTVVTYYCRIHTSRHIPVVPEGLCFV